MVLRRVVGYGTLLLRESLGHTIGRERARNLETLPVIVKGYRRLYNFAPPHYEPAFRISLEPVERAAANLEQAKGYRFNGLAFEASEEEIEALDRRERQYDRVPVPLIHFETGETIGEGTIYVCPPDSEWIVGDVKKLLPHWRDIRYARVGAYTVGRSFGMMFDETAFLADGETLVVEHYKDRLGELMSG